MTANIFFSISYGLYLVCSSHDGKHSGLIANTFFQITANPLMFAICIEKSTMTYEYILKSGLISVSVLSTETNMEFLWRFGFKSGRDVDKFSGYKDIEIGNNGVPLVKEHVVSIFELSITNRIDCKTHDMFICDMTNSVVIDETATPMTYDFYREMKKGRVTKKTDSIKAEMIRNANEMENKGKKDMYICGICGYIYDCNTEEIEFPILADDWVCPVCGAEKNCFSKIKD